MTETPSTPGDPSSPRIRVAVLFGGPGDTHAASCRGAASLLAALDPGEFEAVPVGLHPDGYWVLADGDAGTRALSAGHLPAITAGPDGTPVVVTGPDGATVALLDGPVAGNQSAGGLVVLDPAAGPGMLGTVDLVVPLLLGGRAGDGTIQGVLEMAGVAYLGGGVLATAAATDLAFTRTLARADGIPVGAFAVLRPGDPVEALDQAARHRAGLELPAWVRPAWAAAGTGATRLVDWSGLAEAVAVARAVDPTVLVESELVGPVLTCAVLEGEDGGPAEAAAPLLAAGPAAGPAGPVPLEPPVAVVDEAVVDEVREHAVAAFTALDCAGLAQVDFVLAGGRPYLTGVVTAPELGVDSLFARGWAYAGLDYPKLVERLLRAALRRGTGLR